MVPSQIDAAKQTPSPVAVVAVLRARQDAGLDAFIERRPGLVPQAKAWIHLGANIGAARGPGNILQASDDAMETMLAEAMTGAGLRIDHRLPRGAVPRGEAFNVHRGGGRFNPCSS